MQSEEDMNEKLSYTSPHGGVPFLGRLLISLIFILSGLGKILDFQGAVEQLRGYEIDLAYFFILIALLLQLIGGILLLLGWFTRFAVVILMIFLLPTTLIFHGFWNYTGDKMELELVMFLKNLAIFGGLLAFFSFGPGRWSIDGCRVCKKA
ncbi:MAG: DoxX family protein [Chlamydiales bacterium]|nr:DoxX family protein [Chlamydiales bacterium]